jgi:autotransporter-associated beta strand protein
VLVAGAMASIAVSSRAFAQVNNHYTNGGGDLLWENTTDWSAGIPSFNNSTATIDSGFVVTTSNSNDTVGGLLVGAEPNANGLGNAGGTGALNIGSGSTVTDKGWLNVGFGPDSGSNNYSGTINIAAGGTLTKADDSNNTYIGYGNTTNNGSATVGTLNVSGTANLNYSNNMTTFIGGGNGSGVTGITNVNTGGVLNLTGVQIGVGNALGVLNISGGTVNSSFYLTTGLGGNGGHGIINMTGGTLNANEFTLCENSATPCYFNQSGGTVNVSGQLRIGRSGNTAIAGGNAGYMNLTGGVFNYNDNSDFRMTEAGNNDEIAYLNVSGTAQLNMNMGIFGLNMGTWWGGTSIVTQTGGSVSVDAQSNLGLYFGASQGANQLYNLSGGTLTVPQITAAGDQDGQVYGGPGIRNGQTIHQELLLNGGTLVANSDMTVPEISNSHGTSFATPTQFFTPIGPGGFNLNTSGHAITWTNVLSTAAGTSDGGMTVTGGGSLTLTASNTYTGPTHINGASLNLLGSVTSNVSVTSGTIGSFNSGGGTGLITGSLTFNGSSILMVNPTGSSYLTVTGAANASGASVIVTPTISIAPAMTGVEVLYAKGGIAGTTGGTGSGANFVPGVRGGLSIVADPSGTGQDLILTAASAGPANLIWKGNVAAHPTFWDVQTTANWYNTGTSGSDLYYQSDNVTFDDTASSFTVALQSNVSPTSVTFNNSTNPYTINGPGSISGTTGVTLTGSNSVTFKASNTYSGPTQIENGTLIIGSTGSISSSAVVTLGSGSTSGKLVLGDAGGAVSQTLSSLTTNGGSANAVVGGNASAVSTLTLQLADGVTNTYSGTLGTGTAGASAGNNLTLVESASNNLTQGILVLSGNNTYTGGTNISSGELSLASPGALGTTGPIVFGPLRPYLQFSSSNTTDYSPRFTTANNQAFGIDTNGQNVTFSASLNSSSGGYLNKLGAGTLTLDGTSNSTMGFQVNGGTLELAGTYTTYGGNNFVYIGNGGSNAGISGDNGTLILDSGSTLNIGGPINDAMVLGRDSGSGTIIQNPGSTFNFNPTTNANLIVDASGSSNSVGTYNMLGGTLNMSGNQLWVGLVQGAGYLTVSPGASITNVGNLTIGLYGGGETGTVTQNGGTISITSTSAVNIANAAADTGTYTINGGTLNTPGIQSQGGGTTLFGGSSTLNLNGGTIKATQDAPAFINGITYAYVADNATTIDNNSHNITISQSLAHGGSSTPDGGLILTGSGTTRLYGANSYTGNTHITGGATVLAGTPTALGTGTAQLANGTTLALGAVAAQTVNLNNGFQANVGNIWSPQVSGDGSSVEMSAPINYTEDSLLGTNAVTISDATGFSASFTYSHSRTGAVNTGADGVTFVLYKGSNGDVGDTGAGDGYNNSSGAFPTSIAADVDEWDDQIGTGLNGSWLAQTGVNSVPLISQTGVVKVDINYKYNASAGTGTWTETVTSLANGSSSTTSATLDLPALFGGTAGGTATAYLGFTAATGGSTDMQTISNLSFSNASGGVPTAGVALTNAVSVDAGATATLQLAPTAQYSSGSVGPITIGNGSTLKLSLGSSPAAGVTRGALTTPSVTFANASSGKLDIGVNALDITGGATLSSINALVASGFAKGNWNGSGIMSSAAASDPLHLTAVGVIQNNQSGTALYTSFDGSTPGAGDILVKDTYYGDTNLDGLVNSADYARIDGGYLSHGRLTGWFNGDFNYDGVINGSDYTLIDNAFNTQGASLAAAVATAEIANGGTTSAVPEPATLGLFGIGAAGLLGRRSRRARKQCPGNSAIDW